MLKNDSFEEVENVNNEFIENENSTEKVQNENVVATEKETSEEKNEVKQNKVEEASVIEKIKSFLSKIASMQAEAREESQAKSKEKKESDSEENIEEEAESSNDDILQKPKYQLEYYDLPYRYNETIVKVLAQTPKKLFVYWDISDNDREKYVKAFGDDFFYKTYPVLLLYNEDKKYVREIPINDFANSWYIDIADAKTKYIIQLGRKFREQPKIINYSEFEQNHIILQTDYLPFANSNVMEAPNNHVLFESLPRFLLFRNVKTSEEYTRDLKSFKDAFGNAYNTKLFYENEYTDELSDGTFDMANPSSGTNSSMFR